MNKFQPPLLPFVIFSLLTATSLHADSEIYKLSGDNGRRQIRFYSKAPVENFDGIAHEFTGTLSIDFEKANLGLKGSVRVPVESMDTGLKMRDEHMMSADWLNAEQYPAIQFDLGILKDQKVTKKGKDKWFIDALGQFSLKAKSKDIHVPVVLTRVHKKGKERIILEGTFKVSLSEFGIRGPAAMKIIGKRVANDVQVRFKLIGKPVL